MKNISRNEGHLDANCLFYILTLYLKCLIFRLLSCDIPMHNFILTGVHNGHINRRKTNYILLRKCIFSARFSRWRSLVCQLLISYHFFCFKNLLSQFFSHRMPIHVPIVTAVQNGRISLWKNSYILQKHVLFKALFLRWRSLVCQLLVQCSYYLS